MTISSLHLKRSKLTERTFKRRFVKATGMAPIAYV
jgi:transcriptional regulator GlxA family with amidase domain